TLRGDDGSDTQLCEGPPQQSLDLSNAVGAVSFSQDGRLLASVNNYGVIRIWQVATGTVIYTLPFSLAPGRVGFSPDGRILVTSAAHNGERISEIFLVWDVGTGHLLRSLDVPGQGAFAFSPDGTLFV